MKEDEIQTRVDYALYQQRVQHEICLEELCTSQAGTVPVAPNCAPVRTRHLGLENHKTQETAEKRPMSQGTRDAMSNANLK
jgi:hypothetical protein